VEQLTFGDAPAVVAAAEVTGYEIERDLAASGARLRSVSVAAASIIAKVHRDRFMAALGPREFAFEQNAGYPSPAHQEALAALGPTPYHRLSWSYLDDLPRWRHLKKHRPDIEGQLSLL
jgi:ribonuclease HII